MLERLQKIIAAVGLASRRQAEEWITQGRVSVNGKIVSTLGSKADPEVDHIKVDGRRLAAQGKREYVLVNKPPGVLSTVSDPLGRPKVTDLVRNSQRLYPVGRLDYHSEGLILLTNDGALARLLMRPGTHCPKVYEVKVKGKPDEGAIARLARGGVVAGQKLAPCRIERKRQDLNTWYRVTLHEGKNRQIRNMFESIGHQVQKLRRIAYGPIRDAQLRPGEFRSLKPAEVGLLRGLSEQPHGSGGTAAPAQRSKVGWARPRRAPGKQTKGPPAARKR